MAIIATVDELDSLYGRPNEASTVKEIDRLTDHYRAYIAASPFLVLATGGPEGLDASPRGDQRGFVRVHDDRTLLVPDRRGNNRVDSLRNIVRDPRVALLFFVPGSGTMLRVNGRATVDTGAALCASLAVDGAVPRSVIVVDVGAVYFQCARAVVRAHLWDESTYADAADLPSPGTILAALSAERVGGAEYDAEWPARAARTLW